MEDSGDLEGFILANKYAEDLHDPKNDPDNSAIDLVHEGGARALEVYRRWKAGASSVPNSSGAVYLSVASRQYLDSRPYEHAKAMRDAELSLSQIQEFAGDIGMDEVTPVLVHEYAEHIGAPKSRETVAKKVGYVRRMFDHAVRKGWVTSNVFLSVKLDKNVGRKRESYEPFSSQELEQLFTQAMPPITLVNSDGDTSPPC